MEKKRLFSIMNRADGNTIMSIAEKYKNNYSVVILKEPRKTLTMIKMREPVKNSLFYIGEVIVTEAVIELDGTKGIAVAMGDDFDKTLYMAIIDAAYNKGIFEEDYLIELEKQQILVLEKENAMHMKTMVNFNSMSAEV